MKHSTLSITIFLLTLSVVIADTPKEHHAKEHHDCPAPIGVMGEHQHKAGEMMFGYRFMTMNMWITGTIHSLIIRLSIDTSLYVSEGFFWFAPVFVEASDCGQSEAGYFEKHANRIQSKTFREKAASNIKSMNSNPRIQSKAFREKGYIIVSDVIESA